VTLEVFGEATAAADPGESALDDPAFRKDDEAVQFVALDDFEFPGSGLRDRCRGFCGVVSAVGEDALDEGVEASRASVEHEPSTVSVLDIGGMDDDVQEEAERIDENVPLATLDLLARVVARRIDRRPPFCAPLALCASMIAAVGLASRPSRSRVAT
jgi:hypothetical protein